MIYSIAIAFESFEVHLDGIADPRWEKWLRRFERLTTGMRIEEGKQKRALFVIGK